jgi:hypothetical protein
MITAHLSGVSEKRVLCEHANSCLVPSYRASVCMVDDGFGSSRPSRGGSKVFGRRSTVLDA